jgi:predicted Zn-ribbon and HTH transcriptional regulator
MLICRNCTQTFGDNSEEVKSIGTCPRCEDEEEEE